MQGTATVHPLYTNYLKGYDVALVKLDTPLTYTKYVQPVRLANIFTQFKATGDQLIAVGWGDTEDNSASLWHGFSPTLKEVYIPFVNDFVCWQAYGSQYISWLTFCFVCESVWVLCVIAWHIFVFLYFFRP